MSYYLLVFLVVFPYLPKSSQATNFQLSDTLQYDKKLIKGVLSNGFTYYILPNSYPRKKLEFRLLVKAGSLNESDNQRGLAHFMEHMNFNGSRTFKKNEFNHFFQSIGVRFGADINAFTFLIARFICYLYPLKNLRMWKRRFG